MCVHLIQSSSLDHLILNFQLGIDEEAVKRLSGEFAVSIVDVVPAVKDLKVANDQLELHVIYGPRPAVKRYRYFHYPFFYTK